MLFLTSNFKNSITLDELDFQIIGELNHDARQPVRTLARNLGINRETARYRLNRLLSEGAVTIFCANNFESLGYQFMLTIGVRVRPGKIDEVAEKLAALHGVVAVTLVANHYNIMVWAYIKDKSELTNFIAKDLSEIPDTTSVEIFHTFHHMKMLWRSFGMNSQIPGILSGNSLTELEMSIINELQNNPRLAITELAVSVGCNRAIAKTTVDKLVNEGTVAFFPIVDPAAIGFNIWAQLFIKTEPDKVKDVAEAFSEDDTTMTVALITGQWQISVVALFKDTKNMSDYMAEVIAAIPGVLETETILLGRPVKFSSNLSEWL